MFIGHVGAAMVAKPLAPRVSFGTLLLASLFIDLLWSILLLLGLEQVEIVPGLMRLSPMDFTHYPISHSLLAVTGWGLLLGLLYWVRGRNKRSSLLVGLLVVSHWLLDLIVHRPDLPLAPGQSPRFGLGLWDSLPLTLAVEGGMFLIGLLLYVRSTRPENRIGVWALWSLMFVLVGIYLANLFGPPPPDAKAIGYAGLGMWLFVLWGYWIDRHRTLAARLR